MIPTLSPRLIPVFLLLALLCPGHCGADDKARDPARDILVTLSGTASAGQRAFGAPYRNRKRYGIPLSVRRSAERIAQDYSLQEVDSWPIRSLAVYCIVYRVADRNDRDATVRQLAADARVESVQTLNAFETETAVELAYDDPYANLQHGIETMSIAAAHRHSVGAGVDIAIVDSGVDANHEDLHGRVQRVRSYGFDGKAEEMGHGTAVASVIGARANNAKGIVGVAPRATLQVHAACWASGKEGKGVCDSFSLAQALDTLIATPPDIVNLSLSGPHDALLSRLLSKLAASGAIVVAAHVSASKNGHRFPASLPGVIGVVTAAASWPSPGSPSSLATTNGTVAAPGSEILVAIPNDQYDFRSGSSIAAAHVSGVIALLLAQSPSLSSAEIRDALRRSQMTRAGVVSVDACVALQQANISANCHR